MAPGWVSISAALVPISEAAAACELPDMPPTPCHLFAVEAQRLLSNDGQVRSLLLASPSRPPWPRSLAVAPTRSLQIAAALFSQIVVPLPYSEPDPGSALLVVAGKLLLLASNMWENHDLRTSESWYLLLTATICGLWDTVMLQHRNRPWSDPALCPNCDHLSYRRLLLAPRHHQYINYY